MRILIAIDDSEFGQAICDFMTEAEWGNDSKILLLHVQEPLLVGSYLSLLPPPLVSDIKQKAVEDGKARLALLAEGLGKHFPAADVETSLIEGSPKEQIVECARTWNADLVIVGAHGKTHVQRLLLGSVSQAVCATAPCSVLVVRR